MEQSNMVRWERQGEIGVLSISNGKENYLVSPDFINFNQLIEWTSEDGLKGIIIRGTGRNFSAGADIEQLGKLADDEKKLAQKMNQGKKILNYIEDLDIPVIAAINGVCFGGGLEIALATHLRVCSSRALFAFPELNHGLIPGLGGSFRLFQLLGKKVYDIILSADLINSDQAKEYGFINYIADSKDSFELAKQKLQSMISDRSIDVIKSAMKSIHNAMNTSRDEALKAETELFCKLALNVKKEQD